MTEIEKFRVEIDHDVTRVAGTMVSAQSGIASTSRVHTAATDFEWQMPTRDLLLLDAMITKPGCVPGIRVVGSIDPDGIGDPIGAVRTRTLPVWGDSSADLPTCRLLVQAVGADPSDDDIRDGYSVTLLDLGPVGWRHLRNVVGEAADSVLRTDADAVSHVDSD